MKRIVIAEIKELSEQQTQVTPRQMPLYDVFLFNDDINCTDYVSAVLQQVFGFDENKASAVMWEAHCHEVSHCVTEPQERAEFHRDQLIASGLKSTIEPAE